MTDDVTSASASRSRQRQIHLPDTAATKTVLFHQEIIIKGDFCCNSESDIRVFTPERCRVKNHESRAWKTRTRDRGLMSTRLDHMVEWDGAELLWKVFNKRRRWPERLSTYLDQSWSVCATQARWLASTAEIGGLHDLTAELILNWSGGHVIFQ